MAGSLTRRIDPDLNCAALSRFEELDAADLNRIVTTINRSSLLNSRAALAAAASAAALALRFAADLLADL